VNVEGEEWLGVPTIKLVDALADGLLVVDGGGVVRWANTVAHEQFGHLPPGLLGRPVEALIEPGLRAGHALDREVFSGEPRLMAGSDRSLLFGRRADGTAIPVRVTLAPLSTRAGPVTLAIVRDMTDINDLEDHIALLNSQRNQAQTKARQRDEERDHITQELFGISLVLESLANPTRPDDPTELRRVVDRINQLLHQLHNNGPDQPPSN
jgi:PAS domain S-box-containing protein